MRLHEIYNIIELTQVEKTNNTYVSYNFQTGEFSTTTETLEEMNVFNSSVLGMRNKLCKYDMSIFQMEMLEQMMPEMITNSQLMKNPYI